MKDTDFKFFEELLRRESGLVITPEKIYLLESRLMPIAQKNGVPGLEELAQKMRTTGDQELHRAVISAMTTNETSFFRDTAPFQMMKDTIIPIMVKARAAQKTLRIWSAACSSGQEPYSLAMLMKEHPALTGWKFEIVATDLSHEILTQAKAGVYSQFEIQRGLPIQMLVKYFTKQGDNWLIKQELKDLISFKPINLLGDLSSFGMFDVVFCRNVLIYFDVPTKAKALTSIRANMKQDSVLFLGGAETVIGITEAFKPAPGLRGLYVRSDSTFEPPPPKPETPPAG